MDAWGDTTQNTSAIDSEAGKARAPDARTEFLTIFLSTRGRIGGQRFIAYSLLAFIATYIAAMPFGFLLVAVLGERGIGTTVLIWLAAQGVCQFVLLRRRLQDSNRSLWEMLLVFVPGLNLYIMFCPGTAGPNRFGPAPPPTPTWLSNIALLVFLVVFALVLFERR